MSSRREEELDTLIGGRKKRAGCCATHPRLCTAVLLVVGVVCVAVVVCGTTLHSTIDNKVQDDIAEVRWWDHWENLVRVVCRQGFQCGCHAITLETPTKAGVLLEL